MRNSATEKIGGRELVYRISLSVHIRILARVYSRRVARWRLRYPRFCPPATGACDADRVYLVAPESSLFRLFRKRVSPHILKRIQNLADPDVGSMSRYFYRWPVYLRSRARRRIILGLSRKTNVL